jgi:Tir chaperone protein (CesT) family
MIQSNEDLEGYLSRLERRFERAEDGTYLLSMGADRPLVALRVAAPVLVAQVDIGQAPTDDATAAPLFRKLLVLNATALVHAAYGVEGSTIVLSAALELKNLDLNELEAVLADLDMALANQVPTLRELSSK